MSLYTKCHSFHACVHCQGGLQTVRPQNAAAADTDPLKPHATAEWNINKETAEYSSIVQEAKTLWLLLKSLAEGGA